MKTFKDINGRIWTIAVNPNSIRRARVLAEFDLLKVVEDREAMQRLSDPMLLVDVLFAICKPEADAAQITDEKFAEAVANGDVLEAASNAVLEDLANFFPQTRSGPLKMALAKIQQIRIKAAEMAIQRIESPELEAQILTMLREEINKPPPMSGDSSTSLQGSPALTLAS